MIAGPLYRWSRNAVLVASRQHVGRVAAVAAATSPTGIQSDGQKYRLLLEVCLYVHLDMSCDCMPHLTILSARKCREYKTLMPSMNLQKARECTHSHPEGQLHGRRGRRCVLEDGMTQA